MDGNDRVREPDGRYGALDPGISRLIRRLIEADARNKTAGLAQEVILDLDVDGVRYLVVRCYGRAEHAGNPPPGNPPGEDQATPGAAVLSPRESEIARMVAKGYANKTIASVLAISTWTVSSHLRRIYTKFGVTSRAAMVARLFDAEQSRPPAPAVPVLSMRSDESTPTPPRMAVAMTERASSVQLAVASPTRAVNSHDPIDEQRSLDRI